MALERKRNRSAMCFVTRPTWCTEIFWPDNKFKSPFRIQLLYTVQQSGGSWRNQLARGRCPQGHSPDNSSVYSINRTSRSYLWHDSLLQAQMKLWHSLMVLLEQYLSRSMT